MFSSTKKQNRTRLKQSIACPFVIRFSIPGIKNQSIPAIFRQVNITEVITSHNCGLCNESFRAANRMSRSSIKFDLKSLNNVVHMMKIDPHLSARHLRSILVGCVPPETDISSDYISSFRKRCQIYHAKNPDAHLLTGKVASKLISPSRFSNKELDVLADPVVIKKNRSVYAIIMQNGSNT